MTTTPATPKPKVDNRGCLGCGIFLALALIIGYLVATLSPSTPPPPGTDLIQPSEDRLVQALRDPSSYERVEANVTQVDDGFTVVIKYRAKNGFGGYNIGYATFAYDKNEKLKWWH